MKSNCILLIGVLSFTLLGALTSSSLHAQFKKNKVVGNENVVSIERPVENTYTRIRCMGSLDCRLVNGGDKIAIKAESNLMDYIITEVKGNTLVVRFKDRINIVSKKGVLVTIPVNKSVDHISRLGSGNLSSSESLALSDNLSLYVVGSGDASIDAHIHTLSGSISGSGSLTFTGEVKENAKLSLAGSANATFKGKTNNLELRIAGSGNFNGSSFDAKSVKATIMGSGDADVICHDALDASIFGSGSLKYAGKPVINNLSIKGSGTVTSK